MNADSKDRDCSNVCTFGFGEKLFIRSAFYLAFLVGAYGIWLSSAALALSYAAFVGIAYLLLMRYTVCARCPHVFVAGDCLFVPASLVKMFVSPRQGRLTMWEGVIAVVAVAGTAAIPIYWLAAQTALLGLFIALTFAYLVGLVGRICKKCQVEVCPLNRNSMLG